MNLAQYVKCLKKYAKNTKISDEIFLNAVLEPYITAGKINNREKDEFYLDKSRTSLLLNRVDDVPSALRNALSKSNLYEDTEENFTYFLDEYIRMEDMDLLIDEISKLLEADEKIIDKKKLLQKKDKPNVFLAEVLILAIKLNNKCAVAEKSIIRNGAYCLDVVYEDIFKYAFRNRKKGKNIVVIPVDAEFHTHITRKYENDSLPQVSEKTIHGQWLSRWEKSGEDIASLSERILRNLRVKGYESDASGKYPIGTIATLETTNTIFYLLAISAFDENNNAHATKDELREAIDKLSIYYDCNGDAHDIYIPLMGTGKSRAGISLQDSYDLICDCYRMNKSRIQGNIHIVIQKDFEGFIKMEGEKSNVL